MLLKGFLSYLEFRDKLLYLDKLNSELERFSALEWYHDIMRTAQEKTLNKNAKTNSVLAFFQKHAARHFPWPDNRPPKNYISSGEFLRIATYIEYGAERLTRLDDYYSHYTQQHIIDNSILIKFYHTDKESTEWPNIESSNDELIKQLSSIADGSLAEALAQQSKAAKREPADQPEAAADDHEIDSEDKLS